MEQGREFAESIATEGLYGTLLQKSTVLYRRSQRLAVSQLLAFLVASVAVNLPYTLDGISVSYLIAGCLFALALALQLFLVGSRIEDIAQDLFGAQTKIFSMSWRYAVGGDPYSLEDNSLEVAQARYTADVADFLRDVSPIVGQLAAEQAILPAMQRARTESLSNRRAIYQLGRVQDQLAWYNARSKSLRRQARFWLTLTVALQLFVIIAVFLRALNVVSFDLYSDAGALGAAGTTFAQNGRFRQLSSNYRTAATKLTTALAYVASHSSTEVEWPETVAQVEDLVVQSADS